MNKSVKVRITSLISALLISLLSSSPLFAQDLDMEDSDVRLGYSIGVNIGLNLATQGILDGDINDAALIQGMKDAIEDAIQLSDEEIVAALEQYSLLMEQKAQESLMQVAKASEDFLVNNAAQPGVITTESGLQYLVLVETDGPKAPMPLATDQVQVHYHGTLIDGTVFDSSVDRGEPISFPLNGVIPGWTEGVQLMQVGEKFRFFIPFDLAYGETGAGPIPPYSTLIFDVELLGIEQ